MYNLTPEWFKSIEIEKSILHMSTNAFSVIANL